MSLSVKNVNVWKQQIEIDCQIYKIMRVWLTRQSIGALFISGKEFLQKKIFFIYNIPTNVVHLCNKIRTVKLKAGKLENLNELPNLQKKKK